jgi:pimeloyl-ACP methyl ester carboxylesterase
LAPVPAGEGEILMSSISKSTPINRAKPAKPVWLGIIIPFLALCLIRPAIAAEPLLSLGQDEWREAKKEIAIDTGIRLKYVEMGQPQGPPLVLVHGMTDNSRSWSLIAPALAADFRLIIPDLRGHGDSDKPDLRMYPISSYADDLASLMDALGIDSALVVGHSLGSMIAQALAVNYPEKVRKVVLESSCLVKFESMGKDVYEAAVGFGEDPPPDDFMEAWYSNPNPVDPDFLRREMAESKALPPHAWRAIAKGTAASDLTPFMDELKAPTLILWGSADGFFGAEAQTALKAALPQAQTIDYLDVGHNIHWESPEIMAKDVIGFLKK